MQLSMRDAFLGRLYEKMHEDEKVFFLSADFGAPVLDKIRRDFPQRFINVGIAEQNLINLACGLSLEGYKVFTYAIAAFYLRAYEQIRVNLSMLSQYRELNVTLLAVGAGCSYVIAGPSHHCFEDISVFRTLPGIELLSPSDAKSAAAAFALTDNNGLRYLRLDSQITDKIYYDELIWPEKGFKVLTEMAEADCTIISTGFLSSFANEVISCLAQQNIKCKHIDLLQLKYPDSSALQKELTGKIVFTFEEAFIGKGGIDSMIKNIAPEFRHYAFGISDYFEFSHGNRNETLEKYGLGKEQIIETIKQQIEIEDS